MQMADLKAGQKGRILALANDQPAYRQRLIAMGLIPGTLFEVIRLAPLGDPIEISVRGIALSLRKKEANLLKIEII